MEKLWNEKEWVTMFPVHARAMIAILLSYFWSCVQKNDPAALYIRHLSIVGLN